MGATSTFHGLEVAQRALATQQSALHTTSHNISNANTEGYSRQRVNFEQSSAFPAPGRNRPEIAGQLGTGVEPGQIQRIRDQFLDFQYRAENNQAGQYEAKADALGRMEEIMNEPSDSGLAKTMDQFWESIQDVATNPQDGGARRVMVQRGEAMAETFQYIDGKLKDVQGELQNQMNTSADQVNNLLTQIQDLNSQIERVEPNGDLPNDLYDKRDLAVDQLSEYVNVEVNYEDTGGNSQANAQGTASITLLNSDGNQVTDSNGDPVELLTSQEHNGEDGQNEINELSFTFGGTDPNDNSVAIDDAIVSQVSVGDTDIESQNFESSGSLKGLMESNGYYTGNTDDGEPVYSGDYVDMIDSMDQLAYSFTNEFNAQHREGYGLNQNDNGQNFFTELDDVEGAAAEIGVAGAIQNNEDLIAASSAPNEAGNGDNALALSDVRNEAIGDDQTLQSFYEAQIGDLGVKAQEANRMAENTGSLRESVDQNRESVSGVSLDEEMSNMIQFQHAYNAAARSMTVVDETLDRIINQMGIVGR
ncbi:flagellar hook-associated protein FlgK [Alkalibacillus almallahensis]|uniref:flagellar hook-associated protein FlgK n=1 Tax=Alkalibacillus almallahensis TaxID=1379154 RepID=UPI00141FB14B|nr:flagellar hook-associated protein FlgK [Alkalibacillus almallahensis]NIK12499.1 flagellar hook-associated protein 1 FlgK [Alkalibacillus almallahensis]